MHRKTSFQEIDRPRVLLVALSGIGNLLMASPLFRRLKDLNPSTEIDVLVAPRGTTDIVEGNPRIRRVLTGAPKPSLKQWSALVRHIREIRYDVGLVAHPGQLITSASLLFFGGVQRRVGHRYSWKFLRDSDLFLNDPINVELHATRPLTDRSAHDVVQNLNLLKPLGIEVPAPRSAEREVGYDFPLTTDDRVEADAWLLNENLATETLIGIHPGGHRNLAVKRWPADCWAELGDRLADAYNARVLVVGGPDERAVLTEVCARMHTKAVPMEAPLRAVAARIARCAFFVSNDSGLMHVAVSQGVHTFGLFGPTDERRTAPWGSSGHVIRAPGTQPTYTVRTPAQIRTNVEPDPSLRALSVERVLTEIRSIV